MNYKLFSDDYAASKTRYTSNIYDQKGAAVKKFLQTYCPEKTSDLWFVGTALRSWDGLFQHMEYTIPESSGILHLFRYSLVKYGPELIDICKSGYLDIVNGVIDWTHSNSLVRHVALVFERDRILCATALNYLSRVYWGSPKGEDMHKECMQEWLTINQSQLKRYFPNSHFEYEIYRVPENSYTHESLVVIEKDCPEPRRNVSVHYAYDENKEIFMEVYGAFPGYLRLDLAQYASEITDRTACKMLQTRIYGALEGGKIILPTGSTADCHKQKDQICNALTEAYGSRFTGITSDGTGWVSDKSFSDAKRSIDEEPYAYARMVDVPKSGKKRRLIAPLSVVRSCFNRLIQSEFYASEFPTKVYGKYDGYDRKCVKFKYIHMDLNDQTVNRLMAQEGSANGKYGTTDQSHASDLMEERDFFGIFPKELTDIFCYENPLPVILDGFEDMRGNGVITTIASIGISGDNLTFPKESIFLGLVLDYSIDMFRRYVGDEEFSKLTAGYRRNPYTGEPVLGSVYGDDGVIAYFAYDTACDVATALGWEVNVTKSYNTGDFRESCGGWYHKGVDATPLFFPRKPIVGTPTDGPICGDFSTVDEKLTQEDSLATLIKATNRMSQWPEAQAPLLDLLAKSKESQKLTWGEDPGDGVHVTHASPDLIQYTRTPYTLVRRRREYRLLDLYPDVPDILLGYGESRYFTKCIEFEITCKVDPYAVNPSEYSDDLAAEITKIRDSWMLERSVYHEEEHRGLTNLHREWNHRAGEKECYDILLYSAYLKRGPQQVVDPYLRDKGIYITEPRTVYDPVKDKANPTPTPSKGKGVQKEDKSSNKHDTAGKTSTGAKGSAAGSGKGEVPQKGAQAPQLPSKGNQPANRKQDSSTRADSKSGVTPSASK